MIKSTNQFKAVSLKKERSQVASKQNKYGAVLHKVKVDFGWKIWLLSFFFKWKSLKLNKTNKTDTVEWNFQGWKTLPPDGSLY